jgi:hypothetical protein
VAAGQEDPALDVVTTLPTCASIARFMESEEIPVLLAADYFSEEQVPRSPTASVPAWSACRSPSRR